MSADSLDLPPELAAAIAQAAQTGQTPAFVDLVARYPEHRAALQAWFAERPWLGPASTVSLAVSTDSQAEAVTAPPLWNRPLPALPGYDDLVYLTSGGQGDIFRARQTELQRPVVLKLLRFGYHLDPKQQSRFRRGARSVAALDHPHIIRIFDCAEHAGQLFLAMEYLEGGSLVERIRTPMAPSAAAELVAQLADAMHVAHLAGIVHRDLKPHNVLFSAAGVAKITDFELVKRLDHDASMPSVSGAIIGTVAYMAPEQAAGKLREISPATDIWALGVILFQTLTATLPFQGESWLDVLDAIRFKPAPVPSQRVPGIPAGLDVIVRRCLTVDRAGRYATAAELAQALRQPLTGMVPALPPAVTFRPQPKWLLEVPGYEIQEQLQHRIDELDAAPNHYWLFLAKAQATGQTVAVQVYDGPGATHVEVAAFQRQRLPTLQAQTPAGCVRIDDVGRAAKGQVYVVSEHLPAGTLAARIGRTPQDPRQSVALVAGLARMVVRLPRWPGAEQPTRHGHISPHSIWFAPDDSPRLGIPGLFNANYDSNLTRGWTGEPAFLAPELLHFREVNPTTDVYALGAVLYQLLTGDPPFETSEFRELMVRSGLELPSRLSRIEDPILAALVTRAVHPDPSVRYANANTLLDILECYLAGTVTEADGYPIPSSNTLTLRGYGSLTRLEHWSHSGGLFNSEWRWFLTTRTADQVPVSILALRREITLHELRNYQHTSWIQFTPPLPNLMLTSAVQTSLGNPVWVCLEVPVVGKTLTRLVQEDVFTFAQVIQLGHELCAYLAKIHERRERHGHLHPNLIARNPDGLLQIYLDGLLNQPALSPRGYALWGGDPRFLAPEVVQGNPRTSSMDIYGIGAVLYFALTGQPPFDGDTRATILANLINREPRPLTELRPDVPPRLASIIRQCLRARPEDRFDSVNDLDQVLRQVLW